MWRSGREARGRDDLTVQNDSTLSHQRKRQFPIGVNPPPCPVTALLLLQLVYACLCLHVCVCVSPLFSDIPVQSRETVSWAAERLSCKPNSEIHLKATEDFLCFPVIFLAQAIIFFRFWNSGFRESACKSAGKKSCILNTGFLKKHPLVSSSSLFLSIANPWR